MPAKLILQVRNGPLAGQQFVFEDRTTAILGRAKDCDPRLLCNPANPKDPENRKISRHHCLLDINPPDVLHPRFRQPQRDLRQRPEDRPARETRTARRGVPRT